MCVYQETKDVKSLIQVFQYVMQEGLPRFTDLLCFWHVRKTWLENTSSKISRIQDRASILCEVGNIMYGVGFRHGDDPIQWAQSQLDDIRARRPEAARFMNYMDKEWRKKIVMWCIATWNLRHARRNTNFGVESYHVNLMTIMVLEKHRLIGRILDLCIGSLIIKIYIVTIGTIVF